MLTPLLLSALQCSLLLGNAASPLANCPFASIAQPSSWLTQAASEAEALFYRAYFLENEKGDFEGAQALYLELSKRKDLTPELRDRVAVRLQSTQEEVQVSDLSSLLPRDAWAVVEVHEPGGQLGNLLSQMGLMGAESLDLAQQQGLVISPELIEGALGIRGAAVALTGVDLQHGQPQGIAILHPGKVELIRGLVKTVMSAEAEEVAPILGRRTWSPEQGLFVTTTSKLILAGTSREELQAALSRLDGLDVPSLKDTPRLHTTLQSKSDALIAFAVDADPIIRFVESMSHHLSGHEREELNSVMTLLDLPNLDLLHGSLAFAGENAVLGTELRLKSGHKNLLHNLLHTPGINPTVLNQIPNGAAAALGLALNPERPDWKQAGDATAVSALDMGRELFGNLTSVAAFALPPSAGDLSAGLIWGSNDPEKSEAIFALALGLISIDANNGDLAGFAGESKVVSQQTVRTWDMGPIQLHLAKTESSLLLATSAAALDAGMGKHGSIYQDSAMEPIAADFQDGASQVLAMQAGRFFELASSLAHGREREELGMLAELLKDTSCTLRLHHEANALRAQFHLNGIPRLDGLLSRLSNQPVRARQVPQPGLPH